MKVIVTTGPSFEPIDEVRRLTNSSTGELGVMLSAQLARAGFDVVCLKGVHATHPETPPGIEFQPFSTNEDLFERLASLGGSHPIAAVFHVAALCDYKVQHVEDARGHRCDDAKIESRGGALTIVLEPARKVISGMRALFPAAVLVGWKYELNGTRHDALAKAWRQLRENHTDACVLNGRAWGIGFAFCTPPQSIQELASKSEVATFLPRWLEERLAAAANR